MTNKIEILLALAAALVAGWVIYLAVVPYQRKLMLVAVDDMTFFDDKTKAILKVHKGISTEVVECRNAQSETEPIIRLSDGRKAYPRDGRFRIDTLPTGLFSRPRYPGCPGY